MLRSNDKKEMLCHAQKGNLFHCCMWKVQTVSRAQALGFVPCAKLSLDWQADIACKLKWVEIKRHSLYFSEACYRYYIRTILVLLLLSSSETSCPGTAAAAALAPSLAPTFFAWFPWWYKIHHLKGASPMLLSFLLDTNQNLKVPELQSTQPSTSA